ncbi:MAG: hypothetical protein MMC33_010334 [Icmadophila ericetorum]|nr:hypothetical protein [Icmadophila ericetorum]
MRRLGQSKLGSSSEGQLCILRHGSHSPERISHGPDITLRIPDEVLTLIFEHLPTRASYSFFYDSTTRNLTSSLYVCKRWRRCYNPIHYRRLRVAQSIPTIKLSRSLQYQPALGNYTRILDIDYNVHRTVDLLVKIVQHCTLVRRLSLQGGWSEELRPLLEAIAKLAYVENLFFSGNSNGPSLSAIFPQLERRTLKTLALQGYGLGKGEELVTSWSSSQIPFTECTAEKLLPLACQFDGSLTSLTIKDPSCPPEVTRLIMCWPAALISFKCYSLRDLPFGAQYTATAMEKILHLQRQSLKRIDLGIIPRRLDSTGIPDFSNFPSLETLSLSKCNLFTEVESVAVAKLSTPFLHQLSVTFSTDEQHETAYQDFGANEAAWFTNFALYARKSPKLVLKTMFVDFCPGMGCNVDYVPDLDWPWIHLEEAVKLCSGAGITLTYQDPTHTAEQWLIERQSSKICDDHFRGKHAHESGEKTGEALEASVFCQECQREFADRQHEWALPDEEEEEEEEEEGESEGHTSRSESQSVGHREDY